jgi:deferrochelatase/peroxidase EfeB
MRGEATSDDRTQPASARRIPFGGFHQSGVTTPQQESLVFAAFDVRAERLDDVRTLFLEWTDAARRMTGGEPIRARQGGFSDAPPDSGETQGLDPSRLTLTFGFGPDFFGTRSDARFGLARLRPPSLVSLPPFAGDQLDQARVGGDLCVQACADDPQVAFHAIRNLAALGRGAVVVRWMQQGFRHIRAPVPLTGRNLLGFKDGINNLDPSDDEQMAANVWAGEEGPAWLRGGTYMVVRRIRMRVEHWDSVSLSEQERTFGRKKVTGAPFGANREHDPVDPRSLPPDCHIIQANPRTAGSESERILRRSYSFADGLDARFGELDAGLFFVCFQRDPRRQFVAIQTRLSRGDHLREYVFHTGSGIFAIPPGTRERGYVGQPLLEGDVTMQ